jgi:anaphase-promoting complex subunit 2
VKIRTIELLKIRFGEAAMQVCDVMLKDMADSKRIDDHVHGDIKVIVGRIAAILLTIQSTVHPLIISRMFWPNIQSSSLRLPPMLEAYVCLLHYKQSLTRCRVQRQYELAFHHFKPDKRLRWLQHIGTAQVKLELADRIVEAEATPLQASVAELFEGQDVWTVQALGEMLRMRDTRSLRNALVFWAALGVLKEVKEGWRLLEHVEEGTAVQPGTSMFLRFLREWER